MGKIFLCRNCWGPVSVILLKRDPVPGEPDQYYPVCAECGEEDLEVQEEEP